eukprot:Opistho-1_new@42173
MLLVRFRSLASFALHALWILSNLLTRLPCVCVLMVRASLSHVTSSVPLQPLGGHVGETLYGTSPSKWTILRHFTSATRAVAHMHAQQPPIIHRDVKAENLLLSARGVGKLCDFGSSTTVVMRPETLKEITAAEEEIQLNTTLQYRAPEMVDLYSKKEIGTKVDIWALGILLYRLCFEKTPFDDGSKLAIMNAKVNIPPNKFTEFHPLMRTLLNADPDKRPTAAELLTTLEQMAGEFGPEM